MLSQSGTPLGWWNPEDFEFTDVCYAEPSDYQTMPIDEYAHYFNDSQARDHYGSNDDYDDCGDTDGEEDDDYEGGLL